MNFIQRIQKLKIYIKRYSTILDYFNLFFSKKLIKFIINKINNYVII